MYNFDKIVFGYKLTHDQQDFLSSIEIEMSETINDYNFIAGLCRLFYKQVSQLWRMVNKLLVILKSITLYYNNIIRSK